MKNQTLYMIGNAHIDPVWLWQWQEGFHETKATFRSALDRLNEYDDFVFVASSSALYEWVEQSDPAMFAEIQQRVREGRWGIVGGWWVEPDCNIPSGESLVRQSLYGQHYFKEKFGVIARTGFNVDSFGHSGSIPQILKQSGIDRYVFLRPMPNEKGLPSRLFWWESPDGSRVLTFRIPFEYTFWGKDLTSHIERCAAEMKPPIDEFMCFYGVGNHGGGPTIENIQTIQALNEDPSFPVLLKFATPDQYFDRVLERGWELPTVRDEMQNHASGCYAAHSAIKRWNRQAENNLQAAEKWSSLASWKNLSQYPDNFAHAWKQLLFNQFHDILAGTSLEIAYDDARNQIGETLAIAYRSLNLALQSFAWNIRIPEDAETRPIVVFNPCTWPVKTVVELESSRFSPEAVVVDERDQQIPHQEVQSDSTAGKMRLALAVELPPLGYRTYRMLNHGMQPQTTPETESFSRVQAADSMMENERFRLELDPQTGAIASLFDKQAQVEVFSTPAALPLVMDDNCDTWGHNVFRWNKVIGDFTVTDMRLAEHGTVKSTIRVISEYNHSQLVQEFSMYPTLDRIDVKVIVNWREQLKMLKLRFPVNVKFMKVTYENAYGHIERYANGDEEPMQRWVDVSGTSRSREMSYGFSLLNDGKYSADVNVRDIGLTVLRSPAYANHMPSVLKPHSLYPFIDQGQQIFNYTLLPHTGSWESAATVREAALLNQKPSAMFAAFHPNGALPQSDSFIQAQPNNIMVTVLKQAEDNDDLILRAVEVNGAAAAAEIHLPHWGRSIRAEFAPCGIKTFRIPRDLSHPVREVNLLEE